MRWIYQGNQVNFEVIVLAWHGGRSVTVMKPTGGEPFTCALVDLRGVVDDQRAPA